VSFFSALAQIALNMRHEPELIPAAARRILCRALFGYQRVHESRHAAVPAIHMRPVHAVSVPQTI
jgi:hypothetical protein